MATYPRVEVVEAAGWLDQLAKFDLTKSDEPSDEFMLEGLVLGGKLLVALVDSLDRIGRALEPKPHEEYVPPTDRSPFDQRACRVCGCTDENGCALPDGSFCSWVTNDLCSAPRCITETNRI